MPSPQDRILAFVNTHGYGHLPDALADGSGLTAWLAEVDWFGHRPTPADAPGAVTASDAAEARELRGALTVTLLANARDPELTPDRVLAAEALLRRAGERYPLAGRISDGTVQLVPARGGLAGAYGEILAAVATLSLSGEFSRVKACRNEPCHRAFIDNSRNQSGAYCRSQCSGQVAMRAHRARRRTAAED